MKIRATRTPAVALIVLGALVAAACGGGDAENTATPATTSTRPATTPSAVTTIAASQTAVASSTAAPANTPEPAATIAPPTIAAAPSVAPPPVPTTPPPPPTEPPAPAFQSVTVVARDTEFAPKSLTLPAGAQVALTFDNQDVSIAHDFTLFDAAGNGLAATEIATGPITQSLNFTLGGPGAYRFTCTVHPQQMRGIITVQ